MIFCWHAQLFAGAVLLRALAKLIPRTVFTGETWFDVS